MKSRFTSVKYRLLLLVLLAVIPFFGLTVYNAASQHKLIVDQMPDNSLQLAGLVSSEEKQLISVTNALLATVAQVPAVRSNDLSACNNLFIILLTENPNYVNLGAFDPQGNMICSALPITESDNVSDKPSFQNALQTGEFTIGEYQVSPLTGKDILGLLYPVMDEKGDVERIIFASLVCQPIGM